MVDQESRIQQAIEEISGNESLLEMLETEAATEMLDWGKAMVTMLVKQTADLDDHEAELALDSRLRMVRQFMRSVGNWAAGKYTDPEDRKQLRDRLLGQYKVIQGKEGKLPSPEQLDATLSQVDDPDNTPQQLLLNLRGLLDEPH